MLVGVSLTEIDDPGAQCGLIGEGCSVKRSGDSGMIFQECQKSIGSEPRGSQVCQGAHAIVNLVKLLAAVPARITRNQKRDGLVATVAKILVPVRQTFQHRKQGARRAASEHRYPGYYPLRGVFRFAFKFSSQGVCAWQCGRLATGGIGRYL